MLSLLLLLLLLLLLVVPLAAAPPLPARAKVAAAAANAAGVDCAGESGCGRVARAAAARMRRKVPGSRRSSLLAGAAGQCSSVTMGAAPAGSRNVLGFGVGSSQHVLHRAALRPRWVQPRRLPATAGNPRRGQARSMAI